VIVLVSGSRLSGKFLSCGDKYSSKIDGKIDVSSPRHDSHRSEDAMIESWSAAPVIQFVASKTHLCALCVCWVRPPLVHQMVLGIDAPEHDRELEGGGLTGANTEIIHSAAACRLLDSGAASGQQPCISARTVSTLDARVHRNLSTFDSTFPPSCPTTTPTPLRHTATHCNSVSEYERDSVCERDRECRREEKKKK